MVAIPFCGQAYQELSPDANAQECINFYPKRSPVPDNPDRVVLYPTPGYAEYGVYYYLDDNRAVRWVRGVFTINNDLYLVYGPYLLRQGSGSAEELGRLNTSEGIVGIECNTVELVIDDDEYGYTYNLDTGVLAVISGGSFPASGGVTNFAYIDGYMVAAVNGSKRVIQSDLLAAGTFPALAFAEVTSFPDDIKAVFSDQNNLYLFGPKLTEVRFNAGSVPFAFEKTPGVLIQAGCAAKRTIKKFGGSIAWLASDEMGTPYVATLRGYAAVPLSTPPVTEAIKGYERVDDAYAYAYREGGETFYAITFPTPNVTWVVELATGWWHKRSVNGGADLPTCATYWSRQIPSLSPQVGDTVVEEVVVGTRASGLCIMSQDFEVDFYVYEIDSSGTAQATEATIRRIRSGPHLWADDEPIFLHELRIDAESGVAASATSAEPLASLEISRDGGHTWTGVGTAGMGRQGEYRKRLVWRKLGRALRYTFRLTVSDSVRTYITGASAKISVGKK